MFRYWSLVKLLTNSGHWIEAGRAEMMVEIQQQHHETVQTCLTTSIYLQNSTHSRYNTGTQKWLLPLPATVYIINQSLRPGEANISDFASSWLHKRQFSSKLCWQTPKTIFVLFSCWDRCIELYKKFCKAGVAEFVEVPIKYYNDCSQYKRLIVVKTNNTTTI